MRFPRFAFTAFFACVVSAGAAQAGDSYSLGIEGFQDKYREPNVPDPGDLVDIHTNYGSVTGNYTYTLRNYFSALDARGSYGSSNYKSVDGTSTGTPSYEAEARWRLGYNLTSGHDTLSPYLGVGWRYYFDQSKDVLTYINGTPTTAGYDRQISQFYIPIGATNTFTTSSGWIVSTTGEYDRLFFGTVESRLKEANPAYFNVQNIQHSGFGIRGDFLVGQQMNGYKWEAGPFVRYWHVDDSNISYAGPALGYGLEPNNTRLQTGGELKILF